MATTNPGLDYFPLSLNFYNDDKVALIEAEFGIKGFAFIIKLLFKIYREGYYCSWNDDICMLFTRQLGADYNVDLVRNLIRSLVKRGFFDRNLYEKYGILTSKGIQQRYFDAVSRRKRVDVIAVYLLVSISLYNNLVCIPEKSADILPENVDISQQSKVEESIAEEKTGYENKEKIVVVDTPVRESTDFHWVMDEYNQRFGGCLSTVRTLTPERIRKVEFCLTFWGEDSLNIVFTNILNSSYLLGANKNGWRVDFDWIFTDKNYLNILENKYHEKYHEQFKPSELASIKRKQKLAGRINDAVRKSAESA